MKVRHFGNTANNAYYNALLLTRFAGIESEFPIRMFGLNHGISAPAWETVDFDVPSADWVAQPDWSAIVGADAVNGEFTDLVQSKAAATSLLPKFNARALASKAAQAVFSPLYGKRWAQWVFDLTYGRVLATRSTHVELSDRVDVFYGADSLIRFKLAPSSSKSVCLEHGTVRWIADGERETAAFREAYRRQVQQAQQLWLTNLDPRTLEIAEEVAPGRWAAFPHPYIPDARVPFPEAASRREELLRQTNSEFLVLLPSSQNWSAHHDKGSKKALSAFIELRRSGLEIGIVAVEWGLQLEESKALLDSAGVGDNVAWVPPMARFGLQRMMANVDVVWDQFGLDAFGALALRAVEQGTPLVSRGLAPVGEALIGGPVPWRAAVTTDDIMRETRSVLDEMEHRGRATVIAETQAHYGAWLRDHHSPTVTAALQQGVYAAILDGTFEQGSVAPDQWAKLLQEGPRQEDSQE